MADENRKYKEYRSEPTLTAFSESATCSGSGVILKKVSKMTNTNLIQKQNQSLTINDLQVIEDEPRIKDVVLGERLGFSRSNSARVIISRNIEELQGFGTLHQIDATEKVGCVNRKVKAYYLNEAQALLLCMFSRTAKAAQVRKELIDVYMAYRTRGLAKVREHYRQISAPALPKPLHSFAPNVKNCQLFSINNQQVKKTLELGEIAVAVTVDEFAGAGIYAINRMDGKRELYRCIERMDGKIRLMRDNGDPELCASQKEFNALNKSKVVSVFKCLDLQTEGFKELQKYLFKTPKPRKTATKGA